MRSPSPMVLPKLACLRPFQPVPGCGRGLHQGPSKRRRGRTRTCNIRFQRPSCCQLHHPPICRFARPPTRWTPSAGPDVTGTARHRDHPQTLAVPRQDGCRGDPPHGSGARRALSRPTGGVPCVPSAGLEPAAFRLGGGRPIHWATKAIGHLPRLTRSRPAVRKTSLPQSWHHSR